MRRAQPLAIGDGPFAVQPGPACLHRVDHLIGSVHPEEALVDPGEAGPGAVLVDGGTAHTTGLSEPPHSRW